MVLPVTAANAELQIAFGRAAGLSTTAAEKVLADIQARTANMTPVTRSIAKKLNAATQKAFFTGTSYDGARFAPLKPSTIKAKKARKSKSPSKPLIDTDDTRRLTKYVGHAKGIDLETIERIVFHVKGTPTIPIRNPLPVVIHGNVAAMSDPVAQGIAQQMADYIATGRVP